MEDEIRYIEAREVIECHNKDWVVYVFKRELKNILKKVSNVVSKGFGREAVQYELYNMFNDRYVRVDEWDNISNPFETVPVLMALLEERGLVAMLDDIIDVEGEKRRLDMELYKRLSVLK